MDLGHSFVGLRRHAQSRDQDHYFSFFPHLPRPILHTNEQALPFLNFFSSFSSVLVLVTFWFPFCVCCRSHDESYPILLSSPSPRPCCRYDDDDDDECIYHTSSSLFLHFIIIIIISNHDA